MLVMLSFHVGNRLSHLGSAPKAFFVNLDSLALKVVNHLTHFLILASCFQFGVQLVVQLENCFLASHLFDGLFKLFHSHAVLVCFVVLHQRVF